MKLEGEARLEAPVLVLCFRNCMNLQPSNSNLIFITPSSNTG